MVGLNRPDSPLRRATSYFWRVRPRVQGDGAPVRRSPAARFDKLVLSDLLMPAFGALRNTPTGVTNDYCFAGEQRASYYDADTGRSLTRGAGGYSYSGGNPVRQAAEAGAGALSKSTCRRASCCPSRRRCKEVKDLSS